MGPQTDRLWGESSDGSKIEWMSLAERQAADSLISKYKLMVTHTLNTHGCGETRRSGGGPEVADLPEPRQRMCRPGRNKRMCHFLFVSKPEWPSIISMQHFCVLCCVSLCVYVC